MNRTIKFRAWDGEKIIYEFVVARPQFADCLSIMTDEEFAVENYNSITEWKVMQFTGLYDCEGKEVFEGDILEYKEYYANIKWWSSVEEIPIIAERTEQQKQDFRIEKREVRFNQGAFCLGYTPLTKFCRNNVLVEKLESGKHFTGNYETKQWDFKVIGNVYEHPNLLTNEV